MSSVAPGRAFFRRHIDEANHRIRLTREARKDISAWFGFLQNCNSQLSFLATNWTSSDVLSLTIDASGFAFGAVMGDSWFQGHFPPGLQTHFPPGTPNTFPPGLQTHFPIWDSKHISPSGTPNTFPPWDSKHISPLGLQTHSPWDSKHISPLGLQTYFH